VTAPYDAVLIVPNGPRNAAIVYKGLTRADPTLFAIPVTASAPNSGTVSGSVSGGDALPAPSDKTGVAWGSPEATESSIFSNNPWSMSFEWIGGAATTGNVHALQWTPATGIATSYRGYGVATGVAVANGGSTNSVAIAMTAPVASTVSGTVTVPAGVTLVSKSLAIAWADGAALAIGTETSAATSFNYAVPTGIDSTATVGAAGMGTGSATISQLKGITAGSTSANVTLLAPAVQSTPVANATGVTTSTDFTWTQLTGGLHFVVITTSASPSAPVYYIISTGTTARIPDLSSLGVVLPASTAYSWQILGLGPWASIDDFAGGVAILPTAGTFNETIAGARAFTTQ
jgi:hypothetical protein